MNFEAAAEALGDSLGKMIAPMRKALEDANAALASMQKRLAELEARQPMKGEPGEKGERGEKGDPGSDAPPVNDEQILAQVSKFLSANPPARGEKGEAGERGERGSDAPPITDDQIFAQVAKYLSANPPPKGDKGERGEKGEAGRDGEDAPPITDEQIAAQVAKYLSANPPPKGDKGDPGANGSDGAPANPGDVVRELIASDQLLSLVELRVKEEVSKLPPPKDGKDGEAGEKGDPGPQGPKGDPGQDGAGIQDLLIDRDGNLVATMTDGRTKSLGVVVGRDGAPGRDGKDGADFTEVRFEYDGERTLKAIGKGGEVVYRLPIPIDRGYWKKSAYEKSDVVTEGGTAFIALRDTSEKPSAQSADWRILARKGRDGADGRNGIDKTAPVKIDA